MGTPVYTYNHLTSSQYDYDKREWAYTESGIKQADSYMDACLGIKRTNLATGIVYADGQLVAIINYGHTKVVCQEVAQ
jgi:hypothetical protein